MRRLVGQVEDTGSVAEVNMTEIAEVLQHLERSIHRRLVDLDIFRCASPLEDVGRAEVLCVSLCDHGADGSTCLGDAEAVATQSRSQLIRCRVHGSVIARGRRTRSPPVFHIWRRASSVVVRNRVAGSTRHRLPPDSDLCRASAAGRGVNQPHTAPNRLGAGSWKLAPHPSGGGRTRSPPVFHIWRRASSVVVRNRVAGSTRHRLPPDSDLCRASPAGRGTNQPHTAPNRLGAGSCKLAPHPSSGVRTRSPPVLTEAQSSLMASPPVSRILCGHQSATAIYLGPALPSASCGLPGTHRAGHPVPA